jgi:hypothetical protein
MHNIYHKYTLTIAAIDAQGSSGIFSRRWRSPKEASWRLRSLLDTRGWVAQEQVLSRRSLSYTNAGIFWDCRKWNCSEQFPAGIPYVRSVSQENIICRAMKWVSNPSLDNGSDLWQRVVEDYSSRSLSKESDRLFAIQGIASFWSSRLGDDIVAGIVRGSFQTQLGWRVDRGRNYISSKSESLNAPSWSWGSVMSPVSYRGLGPRPIYANVKLISLQIPDKENRLSTGSLTLEAALIPVNLGHFLEFIPKGGSLQWFEPGIPLNLIFLKEFQHPWAWFPDEHWNRAIRGYVLHMGGYGLCLVECKAPLATFRRVGMCKWDWGDMTKILACEFKGRPLTRVTID